MPCVQGSSSSGFPLRVKWCLALAQPVRTPPKIRHGIAYVRTEGELSGATFYAIDLSTANILWQYETYNTMGSEPYLWDIIGNFVVLIGGEEIDTLDSVTGQLAWQRQMRYQTFQALTTDGRKLYLVMSGFAEAIDVQSGKTIWEYQGLPSHFTFRAYYDDVHSTIVIPADHFYVLDAMSGRLVNKGEKEFPQSALDAIVYRGYLIYGDTIFDASLGTEIRALDDGTYKAPMALDETLYYFTLSGDVVSLQLGRWGRNWMYSASPLRQAVSNIATLGEHAYLVMEDDSMRAVSLSDGNEIARWSGPTSSNTLRGNSIANVPSPALVTSNDVLLASFGTNLLYAFEQR